MSSKQNPMFRKNKSSRSALGNPSPNSDYLLTHSPSKPVNNIRGPPSPVKEERYVDLAVATYVADTTGTITLLNGIAEGDDNNQRNGRGVSLKSVSINGFSFPTATTGTTQQHRLIVFYDNATNGAAPTIANLLSASNANAYPNPDYARRFTILVDHRQVLGTNTAAISDQVVKQFEFNIRLNCAQTFNGTGATVASVQAGSLWAVTLGTAPAGATAGTFNFATRVTFMDTD
jgi:hypothetical protein